MDTFTRRVFPLLLVLASAAPAHAQFVLTSLGNLGGNMATVHINNAGLIAGSGYTTGNQTSRGFLYQDGSFTLLPTLGNGTYTWVNGLNNLGQVVGGSDGHAFIYSNGSLVDLGTFGRARASAEGVNDQGDVVATSWNSDGTDAQAHLYSNGTSITLPTFAGGTGSPSDISNSGIVTGASRISTPLQNQATHAYTYVNGQLTDLGTLSGTGSSAHAINDLGQITGSSHGSDGNVHGFIYADGVMTDIGSFGFFTTSPEDINNLGQVVGLSQVWQSDWGQPFAIINHAFVFQNGTMTDLNSLVDLSGTNFSYLMSATSINDAGQIVGIGATNSGTREAYLLSPAAMLTPVPEPAHAATVLGTALLGFVAWRRRSQRSAAPRASG